jgi:acetyl-CoA decarbonylase/synthase complex subunit gamma
MAFAMQVAAKQKALSDCPDVTDEAKSDLAGASAPPMRKVSIGNGNGAFTLGQETVMFRHEEKFHHPAAVAVRIAATLSDAEAIAKVEAINRCKFERVGAELKVDFCAIEIDNLANPERVLLLAETSEVPIILVGEKTEPMKTCVDVLQASRPLIYKATAANIDTFAAIAAEAKCPLAVGGDSLEELAKLTQTAKDKGVEEMVLSFDGAHPGQALQLMTRARRAALDKHFRPLGYPAMVEVKAPTPEAETAIAASFAAKYGGIVIIDGAEPWQVFPILTAIQDIYTDPQVPNTVDPKLYEIGNVNENSPVLFTTNFALTYFCVAGEVERSKIPAYLCVVETEGMGVLNAYAGDKISVEKIVKTLTDQGAADKVKHRKLIIPGLLPVYRAELEDTSVWKEVVIGPKTAREIPAFLNQVWS